MICQPCRNGGTENATVDLSSARTIEVAAAWADRQHAKCRGGTHCDCQHKTGNGWIGGRQPK